VKRDFYWGFEQKLGLNPNQNLILIYFDRSNKIDFCSFHLEISNCDATGILL